MAGFKRPDTGSEGGCRRSPRPNGRLLAVDMRRVLAACLLLAGEGGITPLQRVQGETLRWDASPDPDIAGYHLYFSRAPGGPKVKVSVANQLSQVLAGLAPGGKYYFSVTAVTESGDESPPSEILEYDTPKGDAAPLPLGCPKFVAQPASRVVLEGSPLDLSAVVESSSPLFYQWVRDDRPLGGAVRDHLTFEHITLADAGAYSVLVQNSEGAHLSEPATVIVWPRSPNGEPVISPLPDQQTAWDQPVAVRFAVLDPDTPSSGLQVTAESSDPALVDTTGLVLTKEGELFTLDIKPNEGRASTATITIRVADHTGHTTMGSFNLTVEQPVIPLSVWAAPSVFALENDSLPLLSVEIRGPPAILPDVQLTADSSDTNLIGPEGIFFAGTGDVRTMLVVPVPDRHGRAILNLRASYGTQLASCSMDITISPRNQPPSITLTPGILEMAAGQTRFISCLIDDEDMFDLRVILSVAPLDFSDLVTLEGAGGARRVSIASQPARSGTLTIAIVALDSAGLINRQDCTVTIVPPILTVFKESDDLVLQWPDLDGLSLQTSSDDLNEWKPLDGVLTVKRERARECRLTHASGPHCQFFRLLVTPAESTVERSRFRSASGRTD